LESKAQKLSLELASLHRDIGQLREALPIIKAKQRSVDPDLLLAELSMIVGGPGEDKPAASSPEATGPESSPQEAPQRLSTDPLDDALAELKKKMGLL
jgi:hypothetical protein